MDQRSNEEIECERIKRIKCWRWFRRGILVVFISLGFWLNAYFPVNNIKPDFVNVLYWPLAFGWSAFLAAFNFEIHDDFEIGALHGPSGERLGYGRLTWPPRVHQFSLHFLGGIVGWVILYLFFQTNVFISSGTFEKLILFVITFLGITGYLPYMLLIKNWLPSASGK